VRFFYALAWLLLLPFAFVYLLWRARKQPDYRRHWPERLGWLAADFPSTDKPRLWIHAVSVGETRAAAPLIAAWRQRHPDWAILLTHATPTGRATGQSLFGSTADVGCPEGDCPNGDFQQAYLPYDFPLFVNLFLQRARPTLGVIMETEIWPNLFAACQRQNLPLFLVNARLSARSAQGYARFRRLVAPALQSLRALSAQTAADAARFAALGATNIHVNGNVKFDVSLPAQTEQRAAALRHIFARAGGRFVWLAASTREGEEAMLLAAFDQLALAEVLLVLVPRHPQRFAEVARLIAAREQPWARRSETAAPAHFNVFLGDSMGEMAAYYAAADVAYIGGSLLPFGSQNLIEAAAAGCPALIGPHTWNFSAAAEQAIATGAALRVADSDELIAALRALHADPTQRANMATAGKAFAEQNRGATERTIALLETAI